MEYVRFGNTGMKVSRMCLGGMNFKDMGPEKAAYTVDKALDHGINFIDTADSYRESEPMLGDILSGGKREKIFLASKVFIRHVREQRLGRNSRNNIIAGIEKTLSYLKTDYLDLYQLHHPDPDTPIEETLSTLDLLVKQGKVRHLGCSNHYAWQMAYMNGVAKQHNWEPIISVQSCYNVFDRPIEIEVVPYCQRFNMAMMTYSPLCGGILTGKYHRNEEPPENSRGKWAPKMQEYLESEETYDILDELREIARRNDIGLNQLAILWILAKPFITSVILGGSKPEHYEAIYPISDKQLSQEDVERIDEISSQCIYRSFHNQPMAHAPALALQR